MNKYQAQNSLFNSKPRVERREIQVIHYGTEPFYVNVITDTFEDGYHEHGQLLREECYNRVEELKELPKFADYQVRYITR